MKTIKVIFPSSCKEYAFNVEDPHNCLTSGSTIYLPAYQSTVYISAVQAASSCGKRSTERLLNQ